MSTSSLLRRSKTGRALIYIPCLMGIKTAENSQRGCGILLFLEIRCCLPSENGILFSLGKPLLLPAGKDMGCSEDFHQIFMRRRLKTKRRQAGNKILNSDYDISPLLEKKENGKK